VNRVLPWALGSAIATLVIAIVIWYVRGPGGAVAAPPLDPPRLKGPSAAAKRAADAPENEAPVEDLPTMPVGTTDLPEQLDRRQLEAGMTKVKPHLQRCRPDEPFVGTVIVKLTIGKSGNVQSAQVVQPPEKTPFSDCIVKVVKSASFPRFRGTLLPSVELTYPFLFKPE
jgi:TonB family protein